MNIEDSTHVDVQEVKDPMKHVFDKQLELMNKYKEIEGLPDWPLNLDLAEHQKIIKDFKQRGMEEIAEAIEGFRHNEFLHYQEELIDALHFFVELAILSGAKWDTFKYHAYKKADKQNINGIYYRTGVLTEKWGLLMNTLKNKPWKQSQVLTDQRKYNILLNDAFTFYISTYVYI
jgi:hypothetical protein